MTQGWSREASPIDLGGPVDRPYEPIPASALEHSVIDRFELMARRHVGRTAVEDASRRLTYGQLAERMRRIASALTARLVGERPGTVAVLAGHDVDFPSAFLGVLAAGRGAVPLDGGHPDERNRWIAGHARVAAVVVSPALAGKARELFPDLPVVDMEAGTSDGVARRPGPEDLAYVLYTSGSTGAPKGVWHDHSNCLNDAMLFTDNAHVTPEDRMVAFYSGVIASTRRTFAALLNGASLHLLSPRELGAEGMVREIRARGITILYDVPTVFRRVVGAMGPGERLDSVRLVRLSGDRSEWSDFDAFRRATGPGALFGVNLGSTEVSSTYAHWFVDEAARTAGGRLPVGRLMRGLELLVEGPAGEPVPEGEVGEFVVRGRHLARGYWRDIKATADAFATDAEDPEARIFRTGDLGLRRPDGLLEFFGRKDHQIKLRGHRIDPTEVEAALRGCSGVADAVVVVRRSPSGAVRCLVAYVEPMSEVRGLLARHVRAMARRVLPEHALPSLIELVTALPRLANFKPDRLALERVDADRLASGQSQLDDPLTRTIAEAFEEVIGVSDVTAQDNLLSLGGDSLMAVEVMLALERRLGRSMPKHVFAASQTIAELSAWAAAH